jgi:hypothetical protein
VTQSPSAAQLVLQAPPVVAQAKPPHEGIAVTQLPELLQVYVVWVPAAQVVVPQATPAPALQVPAPSQLSLLQPETLAVHSFFGSVPAVALTHAEPAALITWQVGQEATPAHSFCVWPWTQAPLRHSSFAAQAVPLAFWATQLVPPTQ